MPKTTKGDEAFDKQSLADLVELWFHCLMRFHRPAKMTMNNKTLFVYCYDCGKESI